jgi:hypothetical protein
MEAPLGTATDRFQYGYDRNDNALFRNNIVNTNFGKLYHASGAGNGYDNLRRPRGSLLTQVESFREFS